MDQKTVVYGPKGRNTVTETTERRRPVIRMLGAALERAPLARYHALHSVGSDMYYVGRYGRGRHGGYWFWRNSRLGRVERRIRG